VCTAQVMTEGVKFNQMNKYSAAHRLNIKRNARMEHAYRNMCLKRKFWNILREAKVITMH